MDHKKSNMKPAIIFTLMVVACLVFGLVTGAIELSVFGNKVETPKTSVESLDYQSE